MKTVKRVLKPALCLFLLTYFSLFAEEVKAPITSVQLYASSARITRTGKVNLIKGISTYTFENLPAALDDESLRIIIPGKDIKILEVRSEVQNKLVFNSGEAKEASLSVKKAEAALRKATEEYNTLLEEKNMLSKVRPAPPPQEKNTALPVLPANFAESFKFLTLSYRSNQTRIQEALEKVDAAREELIVAIAVLDRYARSKSLATKTITISVRSSKEIETPITIEYRMNNARWYPAYAAFVKHGQSDKKEVSLVSYAFVQNETGEDWKNSAIALSAAVADSTVSLPTLQEWHIRMEDKPVSEGQVSKERPGRGAASGSSSKVNPSSPAVQQIITNDDYIQNEKQMPSQKKSKDYLESNRNLVKEEAASKKSNEAQNIVNDLSKGIVNQEYYFQNKNFQESLNQGQTVLDNIDRLRPEHRKRFDDEKRKARELMEQSRNRMEEQRIASRLVAPLAEGGFDYRFQLPGKNDVPSDGSLHRFLIGETKMNASLEYETVPVKKKIAFLLGKASYPEGTPILAGPVSIFNDRNFTGEAFFKNTAGNEPIFLYLGADDDVSVDRKEDLFQESGGVFGKEYQIKHRITITVENRKRKEISLRIFERVPVSRDERIKVEQVSFSIPFTQNTNGTATAEIKLGAREKKKIILEYTVKYPEGFIIDEREGD